MFGDYELTALEITGALLYNNCKERPLCRSYEVIRIPIRNDTGVVPYFYCNNIYGVILWI